MNRRTFIGLGAAAALAGCGKAPAKKISFTGGMVGPSQALGHRLRGELPARPERVVKKRVVIVGGGIAGLSAARRLKQRGVEDFVLLELEPRVGGNSSFAEGPVCPAPWGAHYVPLPPMECRPVIELFKELGVITGFAADGRPIYNEFYLCAEPMERLFIKGRWQEGLFPAIGVSAEDRAQYAAFTAAMEEFHAKTGADGKPAFTIPVDESSRDVEFTKLDELTFAEYLDGRGWKSAALRWHVDYCCRDDFGARADRVSAWAGIHYFASRGGVAANAAAHSVVTWPEGNGWLVKQLEKGVAKNIVAGSLVYRVSQASDRVWVDVLDGVRYEAEAVIFCAPRFVGLRVIEGLKGAAPDYAPWMVANITLKKEPYGEGADLAWDNVFYESESLGYVTATHQVPSRRKGKKVLTYYLPLCAKASREARVEAQGRSYKEWCDLILADLERAHPGIGGDVEHLDVCVWGHGMVTPGRGFVWGEERKKMQEPFGRVFFAHSDISGISLFEEAFVRGYDAAEKVVNL